MRISDWSSDVCSSDLVDDNVLRVGSSNFNNRSLRLDTECDVVIDATRNANADERRIRSEEHTSELQSLMRISYAVFCLTKKLQNHHNKPMEQLSPLSN